MIPTRIVERIHWWFAENYSNKNQESIASLNEDEIRVRKNKINQIRVLINQSFYLASSLYQIIREKGFSTRINSTPGNIIENGKYPTTFINQIEPLQFAKLRSIIALLGDITYIMIQVKELCLEIDIQAIVDIIENSYHILNDYRKVRVFLTHINSRLGIDRCLHGVSGELDIPDIGLKFGSEAECAFFLGYNGDRIYFHDTQTKNQPASPKTVSFERESLNEFFNLFRNLYGLFISHSFHSEEFNSIDPRNSYKL